MKPYILLVGGGMEWQFKTKSALVNQGYKVDSANTLGEAVSMLQINDLYYDLIIADQMQADRGRESLRNLVQIGPGKKKRRVIVLFITNSSLGKMREIFKLGVYDCVPKQDDPERLVRQVDDILIPSAKKGEWK